jgi:hypothetical protein
LISKRNEKNTATEILESVSMQLQSESNDPNLAGVQVMFDGLMTELTDIGRDLFSTAEIIQDHVFESAVVKILNGAEHTLPGGEAQKVQHLMLQDDNDNDDGDESTNYESEDIATAKDAEKRKAPRLQLNHFTPTSNKCERLFSLTSGLGSRVKLRTLQVCTDEPTDALVWKPDTLR